MTSRRRYSAYALACVLGVAAAAPTGTALADPTPAAQVEIDHLLKFVADSQCAFVRNGTAYKATEARDHLAQKLNYAKGRIATAEEFILKLATESSMSGTPYLIRCGKTDAPAGAWLADELKRYRAKR